jgi:hypothetical protein
MHFFTDAADTPVAWDANFQVINHVTKRAMVLAVNLR